MLYAVKFPFKVVNIQQSEHSVKTATKISLEELYSFLHPLGLVCLINLVKGITKKSMHYLFLIYKKLVYQMSAGL